MKMMLGNQIGFELDKTFNENELFAQCYGAFLCELDKPLKCPVLLSCWAIPPKDIPLKPGRRPFRWTSCRRSMRIKLQPVFPYLSQEEEKAGPDLFLRLRESGQGGIQNG